MSSDLKTDIVRHHLIPQHPTKTFRNSKKTVDRYGEEIETGDTVEFLTKGGYHSQRGVVIQFTRYFVIADGSNGNEIRRKASDLHVVANEI